MIFDSFLLWIISKNKVRWTFSTFQAQHTRTSLRTTDLRDWTISSVARTILGVKRVVRTWGGGTNMSCGSSWYETPSGKKWSQWAHFFPTSLQFNIKQWLNIWKLKTYFPPQVFFTLTYRCNSGHHCVQVEESIFMTRAKITDYQCNLTKLRKDLVKCI